MKFRAVGYNGDRWIYLQYKWGPFWFYVKRGYGGWDGIEYEKARFEDMLDLKKYATKLVQGKKKEKAKPKLEVIEEFQID